MVSSATKATPTPNAPGTVSSPNDTPRGRVGSVAETLRAWKAVGDNEPFSW